MTEQTFVQQFSKMPDSIKQEVLVFFEYLLFKHEIKQGGKGAPSTFNPVSAPHKAPKAGFLKGTFALSEDFDAPLDDFKEYMS